MYMKLRPAPNQGFKELRIRACVLANAAPGALVVPSVGRVAVSSSTKPRVCQQAVSEGGTSTSVVGCIFRASVFELMSAAH